MTSVSAFDLSFTLKDVMFNVEFEEDIFDEETQKRILTVINGLSNGIYIDKSYVECYENKRSDTFMNERGWNSLCDLMIDSKYCANLIPQAQLTIVDAFATMARCYAYEYIAKFTKEFQHIAINVVPDCIFEVTIHKDTSRDWKKYPGKWQDWKCNDDGVNSWSK